MGSDKKKRNKTEKDRKNMEKENNTDESDFSGNEIPDLNSLKPFEFEPKTNIGDINSSQKQSSKVFLEISQNPQENTCARISFLIKLQA